MKHRPEFVSVRQKKDGQRGRTVSVSHSCGTAAETSADPPDRQNVDLHQYDSSSSPVLAEDSVPVPPDPVHRIKLDAEDLKIRQTDRRWSEDEVNDLREDMLRSLRCSDPNTFQAADVLTTSSCFEKVKVRSKVRGQGPAQDLRFDPERQTE